MAAALLLLTFDGEDKHQHGPPELIIVTRGFPNAAIELAHQIATPVFSDRGPWHFTELLLIPPHMQGSTYDDRWRCEAKAALKQPLTFPQSTSRMFGKRIVHPPDMDRVEASHRAGYIVYLNPDNGLWNYGQDGG